MTIINSDIQWMTVPGTAYPPVSSANSGPDDRAAAADFARILAGPAAASAPAISAPAAAISASAADAEFNQILEPQAPVRTAAAEQAPEAIEEPHENMFISFIKSLIDIVNPLQHIPVVSTIYRHLTGDEIGPLANIAGGVLYGGPIGAGIAAANVAYKQSTGKDFGETMMAKVMPSEKAPADDPQVAQNLEKKIAPAAGENIPPQTAQTISLNDIVWNNSDIVWNTESPLHPTPPTMSGAGGHEPTTPTPLVQHTKGDTSTTLQANAAPAAFGSKPVPPGLVAVKMMEALDKYSAMKSATPSSMVSAEY